MHVGFELVRLLNLYYKSHTTIDCVHGFGSDDFSRQRFPSVPECMFECYLINYDLV